MVRTFMSLAFAVVLLAPGLVPLADAQSPPVGAHSHVMQGRPMAQTKSGRPARPGARAAAEGFEAEPGGGLHADRAVPPAH